MKRLNRRDIHLSFSRYPFQTHKNFSTSLSKEGIMGVILMVRLFEPNPLGNANLDIFWLRLGLMHC